MNKIRLMMLAFILSAGLMYGCAEKKQPAEKAKQASSQIAESAGEKPAVIKAAPVSDNEAKEKAMEKKDTAPAAAPVVKEKTASKQAPVQAAPVKEVKEPAAPVKNTDAGASIFKAKCSPCHGAEGKGTTMAPALKGNNWIKGASNADIADVIKNGRKGAAKKYANFFVDMPASKGLAETDVNALAEYLKSMN